MHSSEIIKHYRYTKSFYFLSTVIPWSFWLIAGYISHQSPHQQALITTLALLGLVAPTLVSYMLASKEPLVKKDLLRRFFNFNEVPPAYLLGALLIMPISIMLARAVSLLFGYSTAQFTISTEFSFTFGILPAWILLVLAPMLEEIAWHSYGTDALKNKFNLFNTCMIFSLFWGIWHIPLATINQSYQSNVVEVSWIHGANFLLSIFPFVILMNWLYYKTGRNIVITILFHITAGLFNELFSPHPDTKIIQTVLLTILAIFIIVKEKNMFFNPITHKKISNSPQYV